MNGDGWVALGGMQLSAPRRIGEITVQAGRVQETRKFDIESGEWPN
jgi:hypothetical protein